MSKKKETIKEVSSKLKDKELFPEKVKRAKEILENISLPIIDEAALSAQLSKKETLNSVVVDGVEQIRNGKIPGPAMIKFLTLLKIIK